MQPNRLTYGALLLFATGCVEPTSRPSASVDVEPTSVCEGDGFQTVVTLDASSSAPRLSLVPSAPDDARPLEFRWQLSGDDYTIVSGALDESRVELTMAGDRPLSVTLTVRNELGAELTTQRSVALALDCP